MRAITYDMRRRLGFQKQVWVGPLEDDVHDMGCSDDGWLKIDCITLRANSTEVVGSRFHMGLRNVQLKCWRKAM